MVAVRHRLALRDSVSRPLVTRSAVGLGALALSVLILGGCSETSVDRQAVPGLAAAGTTIAAAASAPLAASSGEPAATPSASAPRRPRFDGEKWLRDHGLNFDAEFSEWVTRPKELARIMRFYSRCQPLSLPAVDVLVCPSSAREGPRVPLMSAIYWVRVVHVRAGRLRTANQFITGSMPPDDVLQPAVPHFVLTFRVDGDELVIEDPPGQCERDLADLRGRMRQEPRFRATHAFVQAACGKAGHYRWTGASFVKVGKVQKPAPGK